MGNTFQILRQSHSPCRQLWHQFCWPLPLCCLRTKECPNKLTLSLSRTLVLVGLSSTMSPLQRLGLAILSPRRTGSSEHCCVATDISSEPTLHSRPGYARHFLLLSYTFDISHLQSYLFPFFCCRTPWLGGAAGTVLVCRRLNELVPFSRDGARKNSSPGSSLRCPILILITSPATFLLPPLLSHLSAAHSLDISLL